MVVKKSTKKKIGKWAFLGGVIIAILMSLIAVGVPGLGLLETYWEYWGIALVIVGIIVGFLNVTEDEVNPFLMSGTVLIIASALGGQILSSIYAVSVILAHLLMIFVPAVIIVAIKNVFAISRN
jgi:hypothetical protein